MTYPSSPRQAVYMVNGHGADPAIVRGLESSGCQITFADGVGDALSAVFAIHDGATWPPVLVADVQAGALSLLAFLAHQSWSSPQVEAQRGSIRQVPMPVVLFDRQGDCVDSAIRALEFGVQAYLLETDPTIERELVARLVAERVTRN